MKKLLLLAAILLFFASCDFMFKERKDDDTEVNANGNVVLGNDTDDKGCVASAGYKWSQMRKECIRVFEEGYRLNAIDSLKAEDKGASAYVVFDKEETEAELFLPGQEKSVLLDKERDGIYKKGSWLLQTKKSYLLKSNNRVLYAGASFNERKVIGDDQQESVNAPMPVKDSVMVPVTDTPVSAE